MRAARWAGSGIDHRVVEEHHDAVAGETLERALVLEDQPAHRRVVFAEHAHHFFRVGRFGERGEAAQVEEHDGDFAAVALQRIVRTAFDDGLRELGRKEALQPADPSELRHPVGDALFELRVPLRQLVALPVHLVIEVFDAQQRLHARQQFGLVHRLAQEVIGPRLQPLGALVLRVERRDQHDR